MIPGVVSEVLEEMLFEGRVVPIGSLDCRRGEPQ